jgi:hypothetical protein
LLDFSLHEVIDAPPARDGNFHGTLWAVCKRSCKWVMALGHDRAKAHDLEFK